MDSFSWGIILLTLIFSAFFSGMEIAFVSANKLKIELDGKQGNFLAKIVSNFIKKPSKFIATMLVGNNIALVVYGIFMAKVLEGKIIEYTNSSFLILLIQTIISTLIILVSAEFLPKTLFRINPNYMLRIFAFPLWVFYWLLSLPMLMVFFLSELIIKLVSPKMETGSETNFGRIDLEHYLREGTENNIDEEEVDHEIQIFQNALDFSKVKARECMIPRTEIVALEVEEGIEKLRDTFIETGLSKILIYRDSIDNIIGYTHSFELFKQPESIKSILLPIPIIAMSMPANEILKNLLEKHRSIAVVVDEFGGTAGMITIEDVIEEIFGEIEDEHDKEELIESRIDENEFLFAARLEVDYLNAEHGLELPEDDNYETIAGLIISASESIPSVGEEITLEQYVFTVKEVSDNRIELVHLRILQDEN